MIIWCFGSHDRPRFVVIRFLMSALMPLKVGSQRNRKRARSPVCLGTRFTLLGDCRIVYSRNHHSHNNLQLCSKKLFSEAESSCMSFILIFLTVLLVCLQLFSPCLFLHVNIRLSSYSVYLLKLNTGENLALFGLARRCFKRHLHQDCFYKSHVFENPRMTFKLLHNFLTSFIPDSFVPFTEMSKGGKRKKTQR